MRLTSAFVPLTLSSVAYAAIGPLADLHIVNKIISPDGFSRSAVLAGGTAESVSMPAPLIVGTKGDQFGINVINCLNDTSMLRTTSIHWHGIFQTDTNWADGPSGVSQCPIIPGDSYLYQFNTINQAGTFWYHSHHSTQYCDGLRGPLVVYDPNDPYKHWYDIDDESTVITVSDWLHYVAPSAPIRPTPNSTLINGLGRYPEGPNSTLAVINVARGKRYRFRLISISCGPNYNFSIDNHTMTVIEADGVTTEPRVVDNIQIFAGQRYSFILHANRHINNYWIRANPNIGNTGFSNGLNSAILRYAGAPVADPTTKESTKLHNISEADLPPLVDPGAPGSHVKGGADINFPFNVTFNGTNFFINGSTFSEPTAPVLLQILSGARTAKEMLPSGNIYVVPRNKTVEVSFPGGTSGSPHPIHLHGKNFDVVRVAGSKTYNYVNPVRRDVVSLGNSTEDNVTFRFSTSAPGPWVLHCHINWHLGQGFAIVFATDIEATSKLVPPPAWDQLCPAYNNSGLI